ncbi:MAG: hypothetical protein ACRC32_14035 [Chroococcidiopsis sp.]
MSSYSVGKNLCHQLLTVANRLNPTGDVEGAGSWGRELRESRELRELKKLRSRGVGSRE